MLLSYYFSDPQVEKHWYIRLNIIDIRITNKILRIEKIYNMMIMYKSCHYHHTEYNIILCIMYILK